MHTNEPIHVYFVVLENSLALDLSGPAEALRIANQVIIKRGELPRFQLHFVGVNPSAVLSTGMMTADLAPLPDPDNLPRSAWIIVLGQTQTAPNTAANHALISWLQQLPLNDTQHSIELIAVCAGSIFFAHAGLLRHRKATTHHLDIEQLQATDPSCQVQTDCIFVEDGRISSSAGITAGVDLIVHKIAKCCGEIVAAEVAQWLVMPVRRHASASQHSPLLMHRSHLHPALQRVQQAIGESPQYDWTVSEMADIAHTSVRHLTRLFLLHADIAPMKYVKQVRLHLAQAALRSGMNVTQAADIAGFHSDTQLRRAWRSAGLADTPSIYAKQVTDSEHSK